MFVLPLLAFLLPVWLGLVYGRLVRKKLEDINDGPINSAVAACLGLLAFMLAFTFQTVGNRYDKRKELLLEEVANIRTSFLYAGLVPEPIKSSTKNSLVEYVDIRIRLLHDVSEYETIKTRSLVILDSLWKYSEDLGAINNSSETYSLFISSINQLVSSLYQRLTIAELRLPRTILVVLCIVGFFSMISLGFLFGISGRVSLVSVILLGITFSAVAWLIFALDSPDAGLVKLSSRPIILLQNELHHAMGK